MTRLRPKMLLERYFDGWAQGWGVLQNRFGRLQNQFSIKANGVWDEASRILVLNETYTFDDGRVDSLAWKITKLSDREYRGEETRIAGHADGVQEGNTFRWRYRREVRSAAGGSSTYGFDDTFWLQDSSILIARASVTKFGIEVSMMSVFYQRN